MLGQREKKTYLNIADGKVVRRTEGGKVERYDYVEGLLERIYTKEREFRGEKVPYWYLDLRDSKTGEASPPPPDLSLYGWGLLQGLRILRGG